MADVQYDNLLREHLQICNRCWKTVKDVNWWIWLSAPNIIFNLAFHCVTMAKAQLPAICKQMNG